MAADAHKNFSYSTVATAPSPATSGTSLVVATGDGAGFPAVPFNATIWPVSAQPTSANAEIVRVTARSTDTLTITRAQESTSARTVVVGDQIAATITAKTLTDAEVTSSTNYITGDVTMTTASTYYDGGTLTLAAGTWFLTGNIIVLGSSSAARGLQARLWDGTTVISSAFVQVTGTAAAAQQSLTVSGIVSPTGSTTYKISATSSVNGDTIKHNTSTGTFLIALKLSP